MSLASRFRFLVFLTAQILLAKVIFAQNQNNYSLVDNLHPVSPTAFQFVKYTEMPVSEYTGIPNISIPLYSIDEDGVSIPLNLTYHAGGIRVNEEASWVGLGWDLQVGSIVQQINDQDDYVNTVKTKPDYANTSQVIEFPFKFDYVHHYDTNCTYGCSGPLPVTTPVAADGFYIYTDEFAPFNGYYGSGSVQQNYNFFFDNHYSGNTISPFGVDSEPDIFTANFAGYSCKFVLDWTTHNIVVLDKKGYSITRTGGEDGDTWKVLVPSGDEYDFALKSTVQSNSVSDDLLDAGMTASILRPSSIIWMLTKIITKNNKTITFNYAQQNSINTYPSFDQKGIVASLSGTYQSSNAADFRVACNRGIVTNSVPVNKVLNTISSSQESRVFLQSIVFPKGQVTFITDTNRNDADGSAKLDSISISASQQVKSFKFNYGYFDATSVGGNIYRSYGNSTYRLRLLSLQDNSGATHTFTYSSTQLPPRNSFAIDYWGFYNGRITNTTFVPNASQFVNSALGIDKSALGNNGDNHSANVNYATAGILQQIKYPTGGTVNFAYELNQFNNYWVPDYASSSNSVSSGNGVRIQNVIFKDASGTQLKRTNYTYSGGQAITPLSIFRDYSLETCPPNNFSNTGGVQVIYRVSTVHEINMSGFFSSNPFGSINGVGYNQVTKTNVDASGNSNGKEINNYYNTPDLVFTSAISTLNQMDASLPAYKNKDLPENGSLKSTLIYDSSGNLLKKQTNNYSNSISNIYYGARLFTYGNLVRYNSIDLSLQLNMQHLVGYYPIFDIESLLTSSTETNYFGADSLVNTTTKSYDQYHQLSASRRTNSDNVTEETDYTYPYNSMSTPALTAMVGLNRLTDIVVVNKMSIHPSTGPVTTFFLNRSYGYSGGLIVPIKDSANNHPGLNLPTITTYDQHDPTNGNLLQYTQNTLTNSYIYDYNGEYLIAEVKNAPISSIAYTSFEASGKGRWKYTGPNLPDKNAPTGKMDYLLSNGNVYRDSLSTTQTYVVSYWSKNGAQSVNGSTTATSGYTYNGFTYYEHKIVNPTGGTITVSGTGTIDELRLYPFNAQMSSYTYEPLVGITSTSDAGGKISYYEYDGSKRLLDIRDQSKNIIKAFCYNYAGQPTNCGVNVIYSSAARSVPFQKACTAGQVGVINYTLPLGAYTSTMSQQDADNQAQADINAKGQAYANQNAVCVYPYVTMTLASSIVDVNGHTQNTYTFKVFADNALTIPYAVPANLTVNYKITTTVSYSTGSPPPSTTSTNQTIVVPAGSSQATTSQIDVYHCTGGSNPAVISSTATTSTQQTSTAGTGATPFVIPPGTTICTSSTLMLLPGTGYQIGGFID